MMDADERQSPSVRDRFSDLQRDEERADEPRSARHRDRVDVGQADPSSLERLRDDGHHVDDVVARGELGHDAAVLGVDVDLRGDHVGEDVRAVLDNRRGGLVARALEAEHFHAAYIARALERVDGGANLLGVGRVRP